MSRKDDIINATIKREGGLVNNPHDAGKQTKHGITAPILEEAQAKGVVQLHLIIPDLTETDAYLIYDELFFKVLQCDGMPAPLDEYLFDFGVNSGRGLAAKVLQRSVGALPDGSIGAKTLSLVKLRAVHSIIRQMFVERALVFAAQSDEELKEFGHGWFARLFDVTYNAVTGGSV